MQEIDMHDGLTDTQDTRKWTQSIILLLPHRPSSANGTLQHWQPSRTPNSMAARRRDQKVCPYARILSLMLTIDRWRR